jgi:hypothetical protein
LIAAILEQSCTNLFEGKITIHYGNQEDRNQEGSQEVGSEEVRFEDCCEEDDCEEGNQEGSQEIFRREEIYEVITAVMDGYN